MNPVITILDIETKPLTAAVWGLWKQNVGLNMIENDWSILSYCAKRYGEKGVKYNDVSQQSDMEDDTALLTELWQILDESDFVVAHNGRKFDIPKINARFAKAGMLPPSPYKVIDTLDIVKKHFNFTSNKLEYLTGVLCKKKKLRHTKFPGFELWKECLLRNVQAWREMKKYNIMDVYSLEELYTVLRPYYSTHPNVAVFGALTKETCKCCGSTKVEKRGYAYTQVGVYQRYKCNGCGSWSRGSELLNTKADREKILR